MAISNVTMKKIYYYIICLFAVFILVWGAVDVVSGSVSLIFASPAPTFSPPPEVGLEGEFAPSGAPMIERYYQRQMLFDRIGDSVARIIVSGLLLAFAAWKIKLLEKMEA